MRSTRSDSLQALVVVASHQAALAAAAQVALPLAMWAEVDGSFTNRQAKVQRLHAAVAPAGQSRPGWEIAARLGRAMGAALDVCRCEAGISRNLRQGHLVERG